MDQREDRRHRGCRSLKLAGMLLLGGLVWCAGAGAAPLSLDECIDLAREGNPAFAASRYQLAGSRGNHLSSLRAFFPSVSMDGARTQRTASTATDPQTTITLPDYFNEYYSLSASVRQNLVNIPGYYNYKASGSEVAAARQTLRISEADLVYGVRQQYFLLLKAILLKDVASEALDVSEEQLRKSEALFELGSVARTDVLQARVNRATSVQELISARNAVEQEKARLAVMLGLNATEPLEIRLDLEDPTLPGIEEEALIGEALQGRPEVRRAQAQVHGARSLQQSSFWSQFPTLSGSLFYGRQITRKLVSPYGTEGAETGDLGDLFNASDLKKDASWGWSVGFSWSLFDGFNTIGSIRNAKASVASAKEEQRRQELQAALGVREALVAIGNAEEGIRAAGEAVELAAESLKLQEALYENGGGTILELNNAQVENTRAKNSLIEARIGLHLALAQMDRALGR